VTAGDLQARYEATRYLVRHAGRWIDARIGEPAPELDALLAARGAACGTFITADNPRSKPRSATENATANRELATALRGWQTLPHEGRALDEPWSERGFFVLDLPRATALALAERFGQNAIVWCARGQPPELVFSALAGAAETARPGCGGR
jgi:hypothetical protein